GPRDRHPEERHDRITDVLVHDTATVEDLLHHRVHVLVEPVYQLLRAEMLRGRREADEVGEEHSGRQALRAWTPAVEELLAIPPDRLRDLARHVAGKELHERGALDGLL